MSTFSGIDEGARKLLDIAYAPMYAKIMWAANELNIFEETKNNTTVSDVAQKMGFDEKNTEYLLDALAAMEFLDKNQSTYKNTALVEKYLVRDSAWFIGDFLRLYCEAIDNDLTDIVKLVREGAPSDIQEQNNQELFENMAVIIKKMQKGGREREIAALVASLPEYNVFRKMLDLGGGAGLLGIAVVKEHPEMKGIIFDLPAMRKTIEKCIQEYGLEDRIEVISGDYITDCIGEGYDFIMSIGTLNFAKQNMDTIVKKIFDALNSGGVFLCISDGITHENTRPKEMIVSWLPYHLKGCDYGLKQGEVSEAALRAGFASVYKQTVNMLTGPMDIDLARKM